MAPTKHLRVAFVTHYVVLHVFFSKFSQSGSFGSANKHSRGPPVAYLGLRVGHPSYLEPRRPCKRIMALAPKPHLVICGAVGQPLGPRVLWVYTPDWAKECRRGLCKGQNTPKSPKSIRGLIGRVPNLSCPLLCALVAESRKIPPFDSALALSRFPTSLSHSATTLQIQTQ